MSRQSSATRAAPGWISHARPEKIDPLPAVAVITALPAEFLAVRTALTAVSPMKPTADQIDNQTAVAASVTSDHTSYGSVDGWASPFGQPAGIDRSDPADDRPAPAPHRRVLVV